MSIDAFPLLSYLMDNIGLFIPKLTYSAPTFKQVGTGTTEILAANANRKYAVIVNDTSTAVYLAIGADAVSARGIRLNANGGSFEMTMYNLSTQAINGITSSPGNVTVQEAV